MRYLKSYIYLEQATESTLQFTEKDLRLFNGSLEKVSFNSNEYLIQSGEIENYIYFIAEGLVKAFVIKNGKSTCVDFASENTVFCSFASYLSRKPSELSIQALSKVVAYRIHYDIVNAAHYTSAQHQSFRQKLAEAFFIESFNQRVEFVGLDAQDRYQALLKNKPTWLQRIPVKDLATYLGIHPESLSRLRRKIYVNEK